MRAQTALVTTALLLGVCVSPTPGEPPAQFGAWGASGPEFPPAPDGWTEAPGEPEALPRLAPTPEEARRGYVLFSRDPFSPILPSSYPAPSERAVGLEVFCALGEYEPLSFAIHALDGLTGVRVDVTELRKDTGASIPRDHLDVRFVRAIRVPAGGDRYRMQPFLLEQREQVSVPAGTTAQVWVTVQAPEDAQPGEYSGSATVEVTGEERVDIPVRLEVLPFALPPTPVEMGLFVPRPPEDGELLRRQLVDMREHGMTAVQPVPDAEVVSRDRVLGDDDIAAIGERCKRRVRLFREVYGDLRFPVTIEIGHQIAFYWQPARNWFEFWPHSQEIDADLLRALDAILEVARDDGWPEVRIYALDEAGAHNLLDEAVYYYGLLKRERPELATWTTIGGGIALGHDEIGQLADVVDKLSTNRFSPEIAKSLVARGRPYGIYNGAGPTPAGARFFFGFHGWKTGADEIMQWTYSFGDNVFAGRGVRLSDEGYVYSPADEPLPGILWEAAREGVDDFRYLHALWQVLHAGGAPDDMVAAARSAVAEIMAEIPWTFQAVRNEDQTPPPHPATLRRWRRKVADLIVGLTEAGAAVPVEVDAPQASPLDWEWAQPEALVLEYGPEILADSSFEADTGPWRVEPWEGSGSGELDAGNAHTGRQSMRVDVPAADGNKAVTVLVWPSWGGGGLDIAVEGAHTYEFSAWVKVENRGSLPELRVALPPGAEAAATNGESDADADGWRRIWRRVELAFPAQPNYIAAWVQGPGTAWIDDLSLREVTPPPLSMSLDQQEYDAVDRIGVATVEVSKLATPASVRFDLVSMDGERIGAVTSPFSAQTEVAAEEGVGMSLMAPADLRTCRLVFVPAELAPGDYTVTATLLDADGTSLGQKALRFRRAAHRNRP